MIISFEQFIIDLEQYRITEDGVPLSVEPKVFDTIAYLVRNPGRMISRDELFEQVWAGRPVSDATLSNHIKSARKVLGDDGERQRVIKTIRGRGYQFMAEVTELAPEPGSPEPDPSPLDNQAGRVRKTWRTPAILVLTVLLAGALWIGLSGAFVTGTDGDQTTPPYVLVTPFSVSATNHDKWDPFADQITRELIQDLRKISGIRVVPSPSAFTFKANKTRSYIRSQIPQVTHVLDGFIHEGPSGLIRVSIELETLSTGKLVWSKDFDLQPGEKNVFSIQSNIAASVSRSLKVDVLATEQKQLAQVPTQSIEAYRFFIQGQYELAQLSHESALASIEFFDRAVELDPLFEEAYVARSDAYRIIMNYFDKPKDVLPKVISTSIDVLDVNPKSARARSSLGIAYVHAWLWVDAKKMLTEARERDDSLALTELGFALYFSALGKIDALHESVQRADELDPLNQEIAEWAMWALMMANELEPAAAWGAQKYALHPENPYIALSIAVNEYLSGRYPSSIDWATRAVEMSARTPLALIILAQAYAASGELEPITPLIDEALGSGTYTCPYETAVIFAMLGEPDEAFSLLEQAVHYRSNCLMFTRNDPRLDPLRDDARFDLILEAVQLTEADIQAYEP